MKELVFMQSYTSDRYTLHAKERQIKSVEYLLNTLEAISDLLVKNHDQYHNEKFKLEACAIVHGVSKWELRFFMLKPITEVVRVVKECLSENWVQLPQKLRDVSFINNLAKDLQDWDKKDLAGFTAGDNKPVIRTKAPLLGISGIKQLIANESKKASA